MTDKWVSNFISLHERPPAGQSYAVTVDCAELENYEISDQIGRVLGYRGSGHLWPTQLIDLLHGSVHPAEHPESLAVLNLKALADRDFMLSMELVALLTLTVENYRIMDVVWPLGVFMYN